MNRFTILRGLLAFIFFAAGISKLINLDSAVANFASLGLPEWLVYVTAVGEVACAVLLMAPQGKGFAPAIAGMLAFMVGAIGAEIMAGELPTPAVITAALVVLLWRWRPEA
jgi:uncharacterized membrane protein YphA (DoxX/SURF4 family)